MFIVPGQRHGYGDASGYVNWLRADYFSRYLLGDIVGERRHRRAQSRGAEDGKDDAVTDVTRGE